MYFIIPPTYLRLLLLFCIYTSTLHLFSQEPVIDSLSKYSYEELDSLYFKNFQKDFKKSKKYAEIFLKKGSKQKNYKRVVKGLLRMAMMDNQLRDFDSAHQYIDRAIIIIKDTLKDESLKNQYLVYKGNIYYSSQDHDKALEYYTKSYEYEKNNNNIQNSINIAHNIAMIKSIHGNYDEATKIFRDNYFFLSSKIEEKNPGFRPSKLILSLVGLSENYIKAGINQEEKEHRNQLLDSAEYYNEIGLKKCAQYKNKHREISFLIRKAKIAHEKKEYKKAIDNLKLANSEAERINKKLILSTIYFHFGKNFKQLGEIDNSILYLKKVDSISKTDSDQDSDLAETYVMLTDLYFKKKDVDNALKYHNLFIEIDKVKDKQAIKIQKKIYKNYDIPLLNDKIKKLTEATKKQETKYTSVLVTLIIISLGFILFLIYYRNKQKKNRLAFKKLIQELEMKKKEITNKTTPIIDSELKPKSSISINDEKINEILKALEKFEEKKQFLDSNCDLTFVAKKVKTNKAYLSKVIHAEKQQKFIQYITNLRINYALEKLKEDKLFRSYDIKSIAAELGFKSSDSFSRAFKNKTGIYPSYYIKNINKSDT